MDLTQTPHPLDFKRLSVLKERLDAARAASREANQQVRDLHHKRCTLEGRIGELNHAVRQNLLVADRREHAARIADLQREVQAITESMRDLQSKSEPGSEKTSALGRLYDRCAEFAGANTNA